jgi:hypothetical protein
MIMPLQNAPGLLAWGPFGIESCCSLLAVDGQNWQKNLYCQLLLAHACSDWEKSLPRRCLLLALACLLLHAPASHGARGAGCHCYASGEPTAASTCPPPLARATSSSLARARATSALGFRPRYNSSIGLHWNGSDEDNEWRQWSLSHLLFLFSNPKNTSEVTDATIKS